MQRRSCGDCEPIGAALARIRRRLAEAEALAKGISACPGSCDHGKLRFELSDGSEWQRECPVISDACAYGAYLAQERERLVVRALEAAQVPDRHVESMRASRSSRALAHAREWREKGWLKLFGPPGTGKSFAAAWILARRARLAMQDMGRRAEWPRIADEVGASMGWNTAAELATDRNLAREAKYRRLLVIDDLGKEPPDPRCLQLLGEVVSARYDRKEPTVITTELGVAEISARYGLYFAGRLVEDDGRGGGFLDCTGPSLRVA